jgi:hypothetical protein
MANRSNAFYSLLLLLVILTACGSTSGQYISADTYTRYELLAPETHQFKIYYEVTETRAALAIISIKFVKAARPQTSRAGSGDGQALKFEVVTGAQAKIDSPAENFSAAAKYIKVFLAHPIAERGEYRLAIIKTYKDDKSYYTEGDQVVFKRPLGIPRDSVVLPAATKLFPVQWRRRC